MWFAILISLEDEWDQWQGSELWEDRAGVLTKHMVGVRRVDGDVDGRDTSSYSSTSSSSSSSSTASPSSLIGVVGVDSSLLGLQYRGDARWVGLPSHIFGVWKFVVFFVLHPPILEPNFDLPF